MNAPPQDRELFSQYLALQEKVDQFFSDVNGRYSSQMNCKEGCHLCCQPGLSISPLEAAFIRNSPRQQNALANEKENPHQGARCGFLNSKGQCLIYEERPLVCRSHGLPLKFNTPAGFTLDSCSLNFENQRLEDLEDRYVLNQDLLHTLLNFLNKTEGFNPLERIPLKPSSLWPSEIDSVEIDP